MNNSNTRAVAPPDDLRLYTLAEASEFLRCQKSLLYAMMQRGVLSYVLVGRERRVTQSALREYVERNTKKALP